MGRFRVEYSLKTGVLGLLAALGGCGCGSKNVPEQAPGPFQLRSIALAYIRATEDLGRPPRNQDEVIPFLKIREDPGKTPNAADLFRSPRDGAEFVILWGLDYRDYNTSGNPSRLPVLAYEKHGQDGKRLVLRYRDVMLVTDEELESLTFPRGHRAP
jgi:hypothetical protein